MRVLDGLEGIQIVLFELFGISYAVSAEGTFVAYFEPFCDALEVKIMQTSRFKHRGFGFIHTNATLRVHFNFQMQCCLPDNFVIVPA